MRLFARTLSWLQEWGHRRARQRMFVELGHCGFESVARDHESASRPFIASAAKAADPRPRSRESAARLEALSA